MWRLFWINQVGVRCNHKYLCQKEILLPKRKGDVNSAKRDLKEKGSVSQGMEGMQPYKLEKARKWIIIKCLLLSACHSFTPQFSTSSVSLVSNHSNTSAWVSISSSQRLHSLSPPSACSVQTAAIQVCCRPGGLRAPCTIIQVDLVTPFLFWTPYFLDLISLSLTLYYSLTYSTHPLRKQNF